MPPIDTLLYQIRIMRAASKGFPIKRADKNTTDWVRDNNPVWNWKDYTYGIAFEPLEAWVNVYSNGIRVYHSTEEEALKDLTSETLQAAVHLIEAP